MKQPYQHVICCLILSMLLMGSRMTFAQERVRSQPEDDSLEATQKWIRETLTEHSVLNSIYPEEKNRWTIRVESVNFDGCYIIINRVTTGRTPGRSSYSAKLTDLDPLNIKVLRMKRVERDGSRVPLHKYLVLVPAVEMKDKVRYVSKSVILNQDDMMNYISIYFIDEELANKVADAFAHIIKLCAASRKEPGGTRPHN
jgi:hypothetical protein